MREKFLKTLSLIVCLTIAILAVACTEVKPLPEGWGSESESIEESEQESTSESEPESEPESDPEPTDCSKGHAYGEWVAYGNVVDCAKRWFMHTCGRCGATELKKGDETFHTWAEETTPVPPTCVEGGHDLRVCTVCGSTKKENVGAKLPHEEKEGLAYDETKHWTECENCTEQINATEHTLDGDGNCTECDFSTANA